MEERDREERRQREEEEDENEGLKEGMKEYKIQIEGRKKHKWKCKKEELLR